MLRLRRRVFPAGTGLLFKSEYVGYYVCKTVQGINKKANANRGHKMITLVMK